MYFEIQEKVIYYGKSQLVAWKNGDKSLTPDFLEIHPMMKNQKDYHFGEIFVLRHYYETEGWKGFNSYALSPLNSPNATRFRSGREMVNRIVPVRALSAFSSMRSEGELKNGAGEPDLFLYKDTGEYMFVEVKKESDKIRPNQYKCMAQLRAALGCPIEIVYLCEEGKNRSPKTYMLNLQDFSGEIKK